MEKFNFVLMPARHNHETIDGLPSVFKETEDIFNLEKTKDFQEFIDNNNTISSGPVRLNIYVTGLGPAITYLFDIIEGLNNSRNVEYENYNNVILCFYHYDRNTGNYRLL